MAKHGTIGEGIKWGLIGLGAFALIGSLNASPGDPTDKAVPFQDGPVPWLGNSQYHQLRKPLYFDGPVIAIEGTKIIQGVIGGGKAVAGNLPGGQGNPGSESEPGKLATVEMMEPIAANLNAKGVNCPEPGSKYWLGIQDKDGKLIDSPVARFCLDTSNSKAANWLSPAAVTMAVVIDSNFKQKGFTSLSETLADMDNEQCVEAMKPLNDYADFLIRSTGEVPAGYTVPHKLVEAGSNAFVCPLEDAPPPSPGASEGPN